MNLLTRKSWSPYLVGAGIGLLSWFAFASANEPIGITTAFEYTAALMGEAAMPALGEQAYFQEKSTEGKPPKITWEWMLVVGVFIGASISARLSGDRAHETIPSPWRRRFGGSLWVRQLGAFLGGLIMMFGARIAQGCTSGHGISGFLQLALSSWIFSPIMFAAAVATAFILYGKGEDDHV